MIWLLDTNAVIRILNGRSPQLQRRLIATAPGDLCTCSVVKSELEYGAARSRDPQASRSAQATLLGRLMSFPFDDTAAVVAGQLRADLARRGTPIGLHDLQIAAIAMANGLTLVTHNTSEFGRIANLKLEDWEQ